MNKLLLSGGLCSLEPVEPHPGFKETGDLNYIYKNKLDKACFAHDAAYMLIVKI